MSVSKVGLGWPVGERQFSTLSAWLAALGSGAQEAWCKGDLGTGNVIVNAGVSGSILIRGDIEYNGANHTALATLNGRLELQSTAHFLEARDIRTISSGANGGIRLLNNNKAFRCYSQHTGDAGFTNGIITGQDIQNCVTRSMDGLTQFGIRSFTSGAVIRNNISIGARRAYSGNGANIALQNNFGLQSVLQDYQILNGAVGTNNASQDATGNRTGYTNAEFVNFAAGDYRIKQTSDLFTLNIGAFFEESAGNEQILSATGSLLSVASGTAKTQIINEQSLNTSGSVNTAASGSAATITINEQVLTATGQVSVVAEGAAQLSAVNEQQNAITGSLQIQSTALAQLNSINEQNFTVTGSSSAVMAGFAQVQAVNELAGEQIGFIGGALHAFNAGVAAIQGINDQHSNVAGTAVLSIAANALAIAVNDQHLNLTGSAQVSSYAFAALQSVNEQAGEQIGNIGGQIIAASTGLSVVSAINDQQRSISGTIIVASTGRARLQKINQGNIVLAPERMSAKRITENLSATHIKQNITASRLIDNITAHRV